MPGDDAEGLPGRDLPAEGGALRDRTGFAGVLPVATYDDRTTLAVGLSTLQGQFTTDYPVMMAASFMAMLPLMILFIVLQRRVVEGLAHSGMKG